MKAWKAFTALFADDDPAAPRYDPVQLAGVLVGAQVVAGALFWLLWTLLVFEGGLAVKLAVLLHGPRTPDALRGLYGNLAALALVVALLVVLHRAGRTKA